MRYIFVYVVLLCFSKKIILRLDDMIRVERALGTYKSTSVEYTCQQTNARFTRDRHQHSCFSKRA